MQTAAGVSHRFVDCRPRDSCLAGHVPGAAHADPERDLTGTEGGGRHPLPSAAAFAAWASSAGIGPGVHVTAYDEGTGWAARLWWLLRHFGHEDADVIRFEDWDGPLAHGEERIEAATFEPRTRTGDTADAQELLARLGDAGLTLVDARSPERWRGEVEPIDPVAGRIPGARNRHFLDESPLPADLVHAPDLVVYCGSGVTACAVLYELDRAGRGDARLYPGSFSEWYALGPIQVGAG
ncbi:MAG: sulfurtransferase [Gaiellaceae bacterium]